MLCPECGGPMAATDIQCEGCGYTIPGASAPESQGQAAPAAIGAGAAEAEPPSGGLKYRLPGDDAGSHDRDAMHPRVRKEGPASVHSNRPDKSIGVRRPEDSISAEGATNPPPSGGIGVVRTNPGDGLKVLKQPAPQPGPQPTPEGMTIPSVAMPAEESKPKSASRPRQPVRKAVSTKPKVNPLSTIALVFSLLMFGPIAMIMGVVSLVQIHKSEDFVAGQGRAAIAIFFGGCQTLVGILLVALVLGFGGEMMMGFRLGFTSTVLEALAEAQQNVRAAQLVDVDGDGRGEFATLEHIAQVAPEADLSMMTTPSMVSFLQYQLRVELPVTTNQRERQWWAFMQPTNSELPWLYVDESGIMRLGHDVVTPPTRRSAKEWPSTSSASVVEQVMQYQN